MKKSSLEWCALLSLSLLFLAVNIDGKVLKKCELAKELDRLRVPREDIPKFVGIGSKLANYKSHALSKPDTDGFRHYGIFQIGARYWCNSTPQANNPCQVKCEDLLNNIEASVKCARIILEDQEWGAWNFEEIDVSECFEDQASTRTASTVNRTRTELGQPDEPSGYRRQVTLPSCPSGMDVELNKEYP